MPNWIKHIIKGQGGLSSVGKAIKTIGTKAKYVKPTVKEVVSQSPKLVEPLRFTANIDALKESIFKEAVLRAGNPVIGSIQVSPNAKSILDAQMRGTYDPTFFGGLTLNPNYYYRRGWGIIDDAVDTGIIRVPESGYIKEALRKYPWLDNGNPFSTTLLGQEFPYFSEGKLWPAGGKYGVEPTDLIAIPKGLPWVNWVAGSKWGSLRPYSKPSKFGGRATPLIDGQTNLFPTKYSLLFRLNPETKEYLPLEQIPIKSKGLASGVSLSKGVSVNDDIVKIAQAIISPGEFSPTAQYGLDKSREIFTSPWMRTRLQNMGYSNLWIDNYIQDRLKQMDSSKLSIADGLENVHELAYKPKIGEVVIGEENPILIGQVNSLLHIPSINQTIVQATKRGDVVGTLQHEIGGHGTEHPGYELDKKGNPIYDGVKLTDAGNQATIDKELDDNYYISPEEQRARYLSVAQQMYDTGFNPNSETDFYNFLEFHKNDPETTQAGQLVKYYDWKSMWPAFSKAKSLIPIIGVGLGGSTLFHKGDN